MIEDRLGLLVEIVTDLVPLVEPEYSWGMSSHPDMENGAIVPTERPIAESIDRFSWVTVLGPSLVEDFGGREHVLAAPADRVVKLETNHILLVRTDQFFEYDTRDTALEEYLLGDPR